MSAQFGRYGWEGQCPAPDYLEKIGASLAPYGPDTTDSYSKGGVNILYRGFHTTVESHREKQPHVSGSGAVITWDGRLDNRADLIRELQDSLANSLTDVEIVSTAYDKWSTKCFSKLIGDWALSIWDPVQRLVILAKDPIGTRHLYYSCDKNEVTWSTILEPLVEFSGKTLQICEEYIAGWFTCFPAVHLTPYIGIYSVPPSSQVLIQPGKSTVSKYWDFDSDKKIRYRTDGEYEEHFRTIFATAVRRRLRSDRPVLAELSGGMDSSSIVCMADRIIARAEVDIPRLDTISYYDGSDPRVEELRYLTKVEQTRGRTGYHIDFGTNGQTERDHSRRFFFSVFEQSRRLMATPDLDCSRWPEIFNQYAFCVRSQEYRATLSGIGGEDATGGYVPRPTPELQNLLVEARFCRLARQLNAWRIKMGRPALPLLWEALRGLFTYSLKYPWAPKSMSPPLWLRSSFVMRNKSAFCWYPSKLKPFGGLPSFQNQIQMLNHVRRYLASRALRPELLREIRYPYLDRELLEFTYAVPQEQLVGVGKRRFLMKRALAGIVPDEVLNRKQRAVATRRIGNDIPREWVMLGESSDQMLSASLKIVDATKFLRVLQTAQLLDQVIINDVKRTIFLELWLRHLVTVGVLGSVLSLDKETHQHELSRLSGGGVNRAPARS